MLRFGLFAGRLSHEIALFHCLRAILRFSLELHFFIVMYFSLQIVYRGGDGVLFLLFCSVIHKKNHTNMYAA